MYGKLASESPQDIDGQVGAIIRHPDLLAAIGFDANQFPAALFAETWAGLTPLERGRWLTANQVWETGDPPTARLRATAANITGKLQRLLQAKLNPVEETAEAA